MSFCIGGVEIGKIKWTSDNNQKLEQLVATVGKDWQRIADELGATYHAVRIQYGRLQAFDSKRLGEQSNPVETLKNRRIHKYLADDREESEVIVPYEALQTRESLMQAHGYDTREFELVTSVSNYWDMNNSKSETGVATLYQSKVTVRPKTSKAMTFDEMAEIIAREINPICIEPEYVGGHNLVIGLADMHFGVTTLADTKPRLAELVDLISNGYNTIVIEQLGDLFHSSQMRSSQTLKGTILNDVDMVQGIKDAKIFYDVLIRNALKHAKVVNVETAHGNHDGNMQYMFNEVLIAKYPQVNVNQHNEDRTVYQLGKVGIMISHGDTVKLNNLPMLFANEYPLLWADSETREAHTGHKHNKYVEQEVDGLLLRQFPTIKPNDEYEIRNGWTTNKKIIQCVEYDEYRPRVIYEI